VAPSGINHHGQSLTPSSGPLAYDEADATGVALCHAFTWRG